MSNFKLHLKIDVKSKHEEKQHGLNRTIWCQYDKAVTRLNIFLNAIIKPRVICTLWDRKL